MSGACRVRAFGEPWPHPGGLKRNDDHQRDAVEDRFGAGVVDAEVLHQRGQAFAERRQQDGPDDGSEHGAEPADDRRHDDLDRAADVEHLRGNRLR